VDLPVHLDAVRTTLRAHGVVFALVFGSHAEGRAGKASDVDVAVWSDRPVDDWRLRGALPDGVDLLDLRTAPELLAGRVASSGHVVLDDDPPARVRWQADTRKRYLDEAFRRERVRRVFVRSMVDAERLLSIAARITARLAILDGYAAADRDDLLADRVRLGDLKYTFQTAIEGCIDAAHHVVADKGLGMPGSNAAAFRSLADASVIDADLATALAGAVGFRNVLVHGYAEVDDRLVVAHLDDLGVLRRFVAAIARLLDPPPTA